MVIFLSKYHGKTKIKLFPKRGYVLLLTGILIGFLVFSIISLLFSASMGPGEYSGIPKKIEFEFLYTSEKQGWIEEVTPKFEQWFYEKFGIEVHVRLSVMGTHQTIEAILHGAQPAAWSPASNIWVPYLNEKWKEQGYTEDLVDEWTPLVITPTVIACWKSFQEKYNITGFSDLIELAKSGVEFKYGHPDPQLSNGGTTAVVLEFSTAVGETPDQLEVTDLNTTEVLDDVKTLEFNAVYYGSSTGFFGSWAVENGPNAINVFVVYENVVIDNSLKALKKWGDQLIAIYPEEGTILNDHPYAILNAPWVDIWQRFAASQFLLYLLNPLSQELAQKHGFRPANPSVPLDENIFNEANGVKFEIDVPVLKPPSGEVLEAILTVWAKVRNPGIRG